MEKYCKKCGTALIEGMKFCHECGSPIEQEHKNTPKFCVKCGSQLKEGVKFCSKCGYVISKPIQEEPVKEEKTIEPKTEPNNVVKTESIPPVVTSSENKPNAPKQEKRKPKLLIPVIAVILVVAILFTGFVAPGFFLKKSNSHNISDSIIPDVKFEKTAYKTTPETAVVNSENSKADFDSGVSVSFEEGCLYNEDRKLEVRSLGTVSNEECDAVGYDFTIDGKSAEFAGFANLTLPYDPSWGSDVYVQYLNEETGEWEMRYFETDGNGHAYIKTDHFCTFAVFKKKVESSGSWFFGWGSSASGNVLEEQKSYFSPNQTGVEDIHKKVSVNWDVLAAQIKEGKLNADASLKDLTTKDNAYFAERAATIVGNSISGVEEMSKLVGLTDFAEVLGGLGKIYTVGTFFYTGHTKGWATAVKEKGIDVALAGASLLPPPVGTVCATIATAKFIYDSTTATVTDLNKGGQDSIAEYAYREFTKKYVVYNRKTGECRGVYYESKLSDFDLNANEIRLTCGSGGADNPANANWYTVFEDANRREREGKMKASEYIEMVVQNYTNAFWYTKKNSRDKFLKSTYAPGYGLRYLYDEYETPSNEKLNQYIRNMRNDLNAWIAPFYEKQLEKEYQTYLNNVYTYYSKLEKLMNSTIYISVVDPRCKDFSDSEFYGSAIGLSKTPDEKPCFVSEFLYQYGEKSNKGEDEFFVSFTVASWMKYGCPSYLRVVDFATKSEDFVSPIKLTLNPNKICTVELKSEGEVREEEILGTWNIQSEFADMDSPFVRMIVKFFDGIFGEGSGDDIVESDLDNKKMTQTLVIEKKGNTLYATLTSDGDVSQYTGTFRKGTLKLRYVKGSSDEEALSFGLETLEYKFVRVGAKVVMEGSYKINNYFLKANYKYKGTKIK